jgi:hypothetical protein
VFRVPLSDVGNSFIGETCSASSEGVALPSSLLRTLAPIPLGSPVLRRLPRSRSLGRLPPVPCCPWDLPDVISANLSSDAWPHAKAVPPGARACFFPRVIGLPLKGKASASRSYPRTQLFAGIFSGLQTFLDVQASEFARLPGCSYRYAYCHRAADAFTSGPLVLRCLCTLRICCPSKYRQLTVR